MKINDFENLKKTTYDISVINAEVKNKPQKFVDMAENIYHEQVETVAKQIIKCKAKIVLISGPSSAGKTTSSKLLIKHLQKKGYCGKLISMDDFFLNRDDTPLLPNGLRDYDNVTTVDIPCFHKFIKSLVEKKTAKLPHFDFFTGTRQSYSSMDFNEKDILIIEGIHAFNTIFTQKMEGYKIFKLYIAPNSDFSEGDKIILKSKKLRLMRRMIRDYYSRGQSVLNTLKQWKEVCRCEDEFVLPFRSSADFILDTTHLYEPLVYDKYLLPILKTIKSNKEIKELADVFNYTGKLDKKYIPDTSLIWEFVKKDL